MYQDSKYKPSMRIEDIIPEEIRGDSERFTQFLKAYYEWLQTTKITHTTSVGSFTKNEIIIGENTLAKAIIKQVDAANNQLVVKMLTNVPFDNRERFLQSIPNVRGTISAGSNTIYYDTNYANTILGNILTDSVIRIADETHEVNSVNSIAIVLKNGHSTGTTESSHIIKISPIDTDFVTRGTIDIVEDNVVRKTGKLLEYRDPEKAVDRYAEFLKEELYSSLPKDISSDERSLARKLRDLYQSKGSEESYRFLFRSVFDEEIELKYPGEDLLRISDGKFAITKKLRLEDSQEVFALANKTVSGANSGALGTVIDIRKIVVSGNVIAEAELGLVVGTFDSGEEIFDVDNSSTTANLYGIISGFTINTPGSNYEVGDEIIISGDGTGATARVSSVRKSPVKKLKINNIGYGYRNNLLATVNNTGTGGEGLVVTIEQIKNRYVVEEQAGTFYEAGEISRVAILNQGKNYSKKPIITFIDPVIEPLGMLHQRLITISSGGSGYSAGDSLTFTGTCTSSAVGIVASVAGANNIIFEDATNIIFDNAIDRLSYGFELESSYSYEGEQDLLKQEGSLPTGAILRLELSDYGRGYDYNNLPTIGVTSSGVGASLIATNIQGRSANVEVDTANVEVIYGIGSIRDVEITNIGLEYTTATADLTGSGDGTANLTPIVAGSSVSKGNWTNDDGKIDYKIIQDSEYWQDFSYVIRSGLVIDRYVDVVKRMLHPVGTAFFGEILIYNQINVTPTFTGMIDVVGGIENYFIYIRSLIQALSDISTEKIEKEIPLEALDPAPLTNNNNIDPVVIIEKPIDLTGDEHTEYIVNIERPIDIHIDSDPQKIEKEIPLEALDPAPLTNNNNIDPVVIIEKPIDLTGDEHTEYEIDLEVGIDVTGYEHTEYEIDLEVGIDVTGYEHTEYEIDLEKNIDVSITNDTNIDPVVIIEKSIDLTGYEHTEYEIDLEKNIDVSITNDKEYIVKFAIEGFAGDLAPHSQKVEKEYELPIDVHITSNKEYEIILERDVDVSTLNDKEYIVKFAIEGFAGDLAPHSQKVEKEYELPIDVHITSNKEYLIYYQTEANTAIGSDPQKIEKEISFEALDSAPLINDNNIDPVVIIEKPIDLTGDEHAEYIVNIERPIDIHIDSDPQKIEKEIPLEALDPAPLINDNNIDPVVIIEKSINVVSNNTAEYILKPVLDVANAAVDAPAGPITSSYGEQQIIVFALSPISSLQDITFDTEYLTTVDVWSKITGTVNVSSNVVWGTGTTFLSDFIEDIPIVIDNVEKFIVKSVANNEYMELNVPSQSSYTDVYAYR